MNFRTFLKLSKCKALGYFLTSFSKITIPKGCLGSINQNSVFRNWFEILDIFRHWLLSRNNQNLYCHLNLLPCLHPLRPRLQLRLLVLLLLPTVMFYSLPFHFRPNLRLHLLPVHRQRRPRGAKINRPIEPDLIAWLIPCVGLLMFQFCFVLLKRYRRAGLLPVVYASSVTHAQWSECGIRPRVRIFGWLKESLVFSERVRSLN